MTPDTGAQANHVGMNLQIRLILLAMLAIPVMAIAITLQQMVIMPQMKWDSISLVLLDGLIDWTVWALLTPLIVLLARKAPMFRRGRPQWTIVLHLGVGTAATAIWSLPIAFVTMVLTLFEFDGMKPMSYLSSYLYELQGRSFYYSLFYWLVLGIVTAVQLSRDAEEAAAEAARLESEALAADLQAARVHYDPHRMASELREAAELAEADPVLAEEHILETAGELQRNLAATATLARRRLPDKLAS